MNEKIEVGFVVLEGKKIGVTVRKCQVQVGKKKKTNCWVTARVRGELGPRLEKVEKKLSKRPRAKEKLQDGKQQAI